MRSIGVWGTWEKELGQLRVKVGPFYFLIVIPHKGIRR